MITDPYNGDTDADGLTDGEEQLTYETSPVNADSDNDGLDDGEEIRTYITDPLDPDSDEDGFNDGVEIGASTNPLDPQSFPQPSPVAVPATNTMVTWIAFIILAGLGWQTLRRPGLR